MTLKNGFELKYNKNYLRNPESPLHFYARLCENENTCEEGLEIARLSAVLFNVEKILEMGHGNLFIHNDHRIVSRKRSEKWSFSYHGMPSGGEVGYNCKNFRHKYFLLVNQYVSGNNIPDAGTKIMRYVRHALGFKSVFVLVSFWEGSLDSKTRNFFLRDQFGGTDAQYDPAIERYNFTLNWGNSLRLVDKNFVRRNFQIKICHNISYEIEFSMD